MVRAENDSKGEASALDAADYLLWLAGHECEDDPDFLTPLKLQKLLYYVQGWAFAEWGQPFFKEAIEAWRDGPVVPVVYQRYKEKGLERRPITEFPPQPTRLSPEEKSLIHSVWDAYKKYSGLALRDMTHLEEPYVETYVPEDEKNRCTRSITPEAIKRAFVGRGRAALQRLASNRSKLRAFATANTRAIVGRDVF